MPSACAAVVRPNAPAAPAAASACVNCRLVSVKPEDLDYRFPLYFSCSGSYSPYGSRWSRADDALLISATSRVLQVRLARVLACPLHRGEQQL